jgi:hypothetical protein
MSRRCALYSVVHRETGHDYIGVSVRPEKRWDDHVRMANRRPATHFHHALRKYGRAAFDWAVSEWCADERAARAAETIAIASGRGHYNMTPGGDGVVNPSPEVRRKNAEKRRGKKWGHHTPETRALMSLKAKGRPKSPEARENMRKAHLGKKLKPRSEETKAKIAASVKRSWPNRRNNPQPPMSTAAGMGASPIAA